MTRPRLRTSAVVAAVGALALLAGCGAQDGPGAAGVPVTLPAEPVAGSTTTPDPGGTPATSSGASPESIAAAGLAPCPPSGPQPAVVPGLPDVSLPCLGEGPPVRLAGVRGTPLVLNVWASWCAPCREELPTLGAAARWAGDSVRFLGVDQADDADAALAMLSQSGVMYPSVFDPDNGARAGLRSVGLPVTLFVRADGSIARRVDGPLTDLAEVKRLVIESLGVTP